MRALWLLPLLRVPLYFSLDISTVCHVLADQIRSDKVYCIFSLLRLSNPPKKLKKVLGIALIHCRFNVEALVVPQVVTSGQHVTTAANQGPQWSHALHILIGDVNGTPCDHLTKYHRCILRMPEIG